MKAFMTRLLFAALLAIVVAGCARKEPAMVFPAEEWERWESVKKAGYDLKAIPEILSFVEDSMNTSALMVTVYGKVMLEYGDIEQISYLASVRKSILSMLYGIYVDNGTINLDLTLEDLGMDDIGGLLPIEKQAKVRHLIAARSGVFHPASNSGDDLASAPERGSVEPGTYQLALRRSSKVNSPSREHLIESPCPGAFRADECFIRFIEFNKQAYESVVNLSFGIQEDTS